jgi:phage terminase small subunit
VQGRKPVPTMLNELHGRPNKGRKPNKTEPKPTGNLSDAPDFFSSDQKIGWDYALSCAPPGLLKRLDRGALVAWVVAEDLHRQATVAQNRLGQLLVRTPNTQQLVQSPYLPVINRQALIMLKAASELGFTPVSRPRIFGGASPPGEGLYGDQIPKGQQQQASLDDFLASDPDGAPTLN